MDFHYDMPVILPNQQQYKLLEVRMIAANNQPWTVSQVGRQGERNWS